MFSIQEQVKSRGKATRKAKWKGNDDDQMQEKGRQVFCTRGKKEEWRQKTCCFFSIQHLLYAFLGLNSLNRNMGR